MTNDKCRKKSEFLKSEQPDQALLGFIGHLDFGIRLTLVIRHSDLTTSAGADQGSRVRSPYPRPIHESVAADVRRLCSIGFLQSEPPYVGCYKTAFS